MDMKKLLGSYKFKGDEYLHKFSSGFFNVYDEFKGRGTCQILAEIGFNFQLNIKDYYYTIISNLAGWTGFFCYVAGALENDF